MKRSLLRLCQSREKAAASSSYQGVVCEADAASVASQDVFKVRAEGRGREVGGSRGLGGGWEGEGAAWGTEAGVGQDGCPGLGLPWGWL